MNQSLDYGTVVRTTSALTVLAWVAVDTTGSASAISSASACHILSIGSSADPSGSIDNIILRISQTAASAEILVGGKNGGTSASLLVENIKNGMFGEWHHIGVVIQSEVGRDNVTMGLSGIRIYLNGWETLTSSITSGFLSLSGVERPVLRIGGVFGSNDDLNTVNSGLTGSLGMIRVFNRSLSASEIRQNYLSSLPAMHQIDNISIA